jgi:23S rRNA (pseudouridine1915-N3)-methyltransferase
MKINIYTHAKKILPFYSDAIKEYQKRLSRFAKVKIIKIKPSELNKKLNLDSYIIKVSSKGSSMSSPDLALLFETLALAGSSEVNFVITDESIEPTNHISLSQMNLSDDLSLTILHEQVYRSFSITNNLPYHK